MKWITIILMAVSALLSLKHGWDAFRPAGPEQVQFTANLGIYPNMIPYIGVLSMITGILLLFPQTFFISNLINAVVILLIMALCLRSGDLRTALIEIPFLALPLLLIWLKYPTANNYI